ncbi:MAG: DUF6152 family protein [Gammaproteobacteria bacterium]|nr:DUF6152 family protein [Gammaproteobacteria bacterium]
MNDMLGQQSMTAARFVDEKPSKQKRCSLWPIWLALLPVLGWAHHSRLAFDLDASITVEGYVTEVGWTNPHFYLGMREQTDTGEVNWVFEGHSIPGLLRNGWSKTSLRVDDRVRVVANPSRREEVQFALLDHVTRVDGNTFYSFRRPDNARPVQPPLQPATDLTGTWVLIRSLRANLISVVEPPKDWPLQPIAQVDVEKFDLRDDPALRCEPLGLPRMLVWPYARRWRALDDGFSVEIEHSEEHRRIYDRAQGHTGTSGISVGTKQPDGSYKIVTTGFVPQPWGNARGIGSSDQKRITELYTLEEGGYKLRLDYSLEDPVYLRAPVTMTESFRKLHDFEFGEEPPCDVATATRHLDFER